MKLIAGTEIKFDGSLERVRASNPLTPASIDKAAGTIEGVFATKTRVLSYHFEIGAYYEELGFEESMVRMDRLNMAAPVLNKHNRYDEELGIVLNAKLSSENISGTLRFDINGEKGKEAFRKIEDGFIRTLSAGYKVYKLRYIEDAADGKPVYRAVDWEPFEISTAPIAADVYSQIRTDIDKNPQPKILQNQKTNKMADELTPDQIAENTRIAKEKNDAILLERTAERTRVSEINKICIEHNRKAEFIQKHIDEGATVDAVRALILEDIKTQQPDVRVGNRADGFKDDSTRAMAMAEAVCFRMDNKTFALPKERSDNPFIHKSLMEMCREYLVEKGLPTTGGDRQCVTRAMDYGMRNRTVGMTTSDFPNIFANILHQVLRKDYSFTTGAWKKFAFKQDASRVNTKETNVQLGDFAKMAKVIEGAEYKRQAVNEAAEEFTAFKYGSEFGITLEMIINDDLGAMMRLAQKAPKMGAFTEDYLAWALINSNPTMQDGFAVFSTEHANLVSGTAMTAETLNALYLLVANQTALKNGDGTTGEPIDLTPKYILTGNSNKYLLDQILNKATQFTKASDRVPTYIQNLEPIYTSKITTGAYYMIADPSAIDIIRYGGVSGEPEFSVEEIMEAKTDSWIWHCRKFFGISFVDYRGIAKNPGA